MKAVIQRVKSGKVIINNQVVGEIDKGLVVLLGVGEGDEEKEIQLLAKKIVNLRIMSDKQGKMNLSVKDVDAEVLVVSQFTLLADCKKGNRPSFIQAANPELAEGLYQKFIKELKNLGIKKVATGKFAAMMNIHLINAGPVTIVLDTENM
ncbi:D-tyrosyl-tRNA(Tyr) deacylase [Candidatus Microgenomates bacterium]|nr:D-tyrosyl-tRNA(Tyr) deacylase [Candidatus Microgenomates bacterium]